MSIFTMVRSQSEPRVREPVWRPRTSLMTQKNILKITIRSKNLIVELIQNRNFLAEVAATYMAGITLLP